MHPVQVETGGVGEPGNARHIKVETGNRMPFFHRVDANGIEQINGDVFITHVDAVAPDGHASIVVPSADGQGGGYINV